YYSSVGTAKIGVNLNVIGRGKVVCPINGIKTVFEEVLHIPELSSNLLSPGKLTSSGLSVNLGTKQVVITRDKRVVATGPRIGSTWVLRAGSPQEKALKAGLASREEALLWHRRLGHPGPEKLFLISQAVTDMPILSRADAPDCNTCNLTKSYRILDPRTGTITESSHVTFKENQKGGSLIAGTDESTLYSLDDEVPDEVFDQEEEMTIQLPDMGTNELIVDESCVEDLESSTVQAENQESTDNETRVRPQRQRRPPQRYINELEEEAISRRHDNHAA
ncbi:Copia-like retrotransposable element, partial [Thalictrum thalictroides]